MMKVFKFGGASVKDADSVRNVGNIIRLYPQDKLCIVVSAMGKTTNGLEKVVNAYFEGKTKQSFEALDEIKRYHEDILHDLFPDTTNAIYNDVNNLFVEIEWAIEDAPTGTYDFEYDQIVSVGELISTKIVSAYLNEIQIENRWFDARDLIRTDNTYRAAIVDWNLTGDLIRNNVGSYLETNGRVAISQGFIGVTSENFTTTLGREGSDYSAAIFAFSLGAQDMTIWKDVPGMLNADPKWFDDTRKLNHISYREAIELAYYGATVIHPKTIKPLENKNIPLHVKSFLDPKQSGTLINNVTDSDSLIPSYIFKVNQLLISISAKDFSFIVEHNLSRIFDIFHKHQVPINIMQNSAINFSVSTDYDDRKSPGLIKELQEDFKVYYNEGMELITIRHYDDETIDKVLEDKKLYLEQKTRHTARFVMKPVA